MEKTLNLLDPRDYVHNIVTTSLDENNFTHNTDSYLFFCTSYIHNKIAVIYITTPQTYQDRAGSPKIQMLYIHTSLHENNFTCNTDSYLHFWSSYIHNKVANIPRYQHCVRIQTIKTNSHDHLLHTYHAQFLFTCVGYPEKRVVITYHSLISGNTINMWKKQKFCT